MSTWRFVRDFHDKPSGRTIKAGTKGEFVLASQDHPDSNWIAVKLADQTTVWAQADRDVEPDR